MSRNGARAAERRVARRYVLFALGDGVPLAPEQNCSGPAPRAAPRPRAADNRSRAPLDDRAAPLRGGNLSRANFTIHYATHPAGPWQAWEAYIEDWPPAAGAGTSRRLRDARSRPPPRRRRDPPEDGSRRRSFPRRDNFDYGANGNWNPAPMVHPATGEVYVMAHTSPTAFDGEALIVADSWRGPYVRRAG